MKTFTIYRAEVVDGRVVVRMFYDMRFDRGAYIHEYPGLAFDRSTYAEYRPELGWRKTWKAAVGVLLKQYRKFHRIAQKEADKLGDIVLQAEELYHE